MAIPSAKRQASVPEVKKQPEASKGILSHLANKKQRVADDESLADALTADTRVEIDVILEQFDSLPAKDPRPLSELIEYDELGLPK